MEHITAEAIREAIPDVTPALVEESQPVPYRREKPRWQLPFRLSPEGGGDERQKKALRYLARFFAAVLVFTLVARGTAGATLPKVDTASPYSAEIVELVELSATADGAATHQPQLPEGITIKQILAVPGQNVKVGDALAVLDTEELAEQRQRETVKLSSLELSLQQLLNGKPYDGSALTSAQTALDWANQDAANIAVAGQAGIDEATRTVEAAAAAQAEAAANYDAVTANPDSTPEEVAAATTQLDEANAALNTANAALETARQTAAQNNQAAQRDAETARQSLASAQATDAAARQEAADTAAKNNVDAEGLRLDIQQQQQLLELYSTIGADGRVLSTVEGTVLEIGTEETKTGEGLLAKITDASGGFRAKGSLPKAKAEKLAAGARAEISLQNGYFGGQSAGYATLLSLGDPDAEGMVSATFALPDGDWSQGQALLLKAEQSRDSYDTCVPLTALHQSQSGYYVFVMEETAGVLGAENVVKTLPVTLLASDGEAAAISGPVARGDKVVSATTKPLAEGDKVRVNNV